MLEVSLLNFDHREQTGIVTPLLKASERENMNSELSFNSSTPGFYLAEDSDFPVLGLNKDSSQH